MIIFIKKVLAATLTIRFINKFIIRRVLLYEHTSKSELFKPLFICPTYKNQSEQVDKHIFSPKIQYHNKMAQEVESHILRRYELVRKIGSGAYGHVWKVIDKKTEQVLALKKIFDAFQHATDAQRTYREIMFLQQFDHVNIIKLHNVIRAENNKDIYLVFEYMDIDLHTVIRQNILKQKHKQYIIYQTAKAIKYLHNAQLIHRDLKPSNILLNSDCMVKVCDFGLVRSLAKSDDDVPAIMTEYVATRWYRAPEILLGSHTYTKGVDIWAFGCLVGEMIRGKPLFTGTSTVNQLEKLLSWTGAPSVAEVQALQSDVGWSMIQNLRGIKQRNIREWLPNADELAIDLISKTLQFNPKKRITIEEVLRHPYLKDFHNSTPQPVPRPITHPIDDNKKLSLKEYRTLIYAEIDKKAALDKEKEKQKGKIQDLAKCQIKCQVPSYQKPRKKSFKNIQKEDQQDPELKQQYAAKTVYIQQKKKANTTMYTSPMKPVERSSSGQKQYQMMKAKYLTEQKTVSRSKNRGKVASLYTSKKNSLKDESEQKPMSFDDVGKKRLSIYSAATKKTPLLAKYLHKPVRLI